MVSTAHSIYTLRSQDKIGLDALNQAENWRSAAQPYLNRFNEIDRLLHSALPKGMLAAMLIELEISYTALSKLPHPDCVKPARWHLLNAVNDLLTALTDRIAGSLTESMAYLKAAQIELEFHRKELLKLGIG